MSKNENIDCGFKWFERPMGGGNSIYVCGICASLSPDKTPYCPECGNRMKDVELSEYNGSTDNFVEFVKSRVEYANSVNIEE